jgi:hypothetical protein
MLLESRFTRFYLLHTVSSLKAPCVGGYKLFNGCHHLFASNGSDPTIHEMHSTEVKKKQMC